MSWKPRNAWCAVIEKASLAADHPLRALYEEFADHAEVFAFSVDPKTAADLKETLRETDRVSCSMGATARGRRVIRRVCFSTAAKKEYENLDRADSA